MATTTTGKVRTLGPGSLKITTSSGSGGTSKDFSADLVKVQLVPSNSSDDPTTYLDGSVETNTDTTWTLEGTIVDDFSQDGAATWFFDNAGNTYEFTFIPATAGAVQWKGKATITPIGIGGDVKAKNQQDISLPVTDLSHSTKTA